VCTESLEEVGPDAEDSDGEEEEEKGGGEGVEEGACAGFEEDVEWGDHGSDDEEWCGDGAGGEDGDLDVEPEGEGDGPEEGVPVLEPVEDGVAEEAKGDDEGRFLVLGVPAISNADNGDADWDQEEKGVEDDAMKSKEDVKVWENGDPDEEQYPLGLLDEN